MYTGCSFSKGMHMVEEAMQTSGGSPLDTWDFPLENEALPVYREPLSMSSLSLSMHIEAAGLMQSVDTDLKIYLSEWDIHLFTSLQHLTTETQCSEASFSKQVSNPVSEYVLTAI